MSTEKPAAAPETFDEMQRRIWDDVICDHDGHCNDAVGADFARRLRDALAEQAEPIGWTNNEFFSPPKHEQDNRTMAVWKRKMRGKCEIPLYAAAAAASAGMDEQAQKIAALERELAGIREVAANRSCIPKVIAELGPLSLWSKSGLEAHIQSKVSVLEHALRDCERATIERCAQVCDELNYMIDIGDWREMTKREHGAVACRKCAEAIRALAQHAGEERSTPPIPGLSVSSEIRAMPKELSVLSAKAHPGPWHAVKPANGASNDTPYILGASKSLGVHGDPILSGLWPLHDGTKDATEKAEAVTFGTTMFVTELVNWYRAEAAEARVRELEAK